MATAKLKIGEIQEAIFEEKSSGFFLHKKKLGLFYYMVLLAREKLKLILKQLTFV